MNKPVIVISSHVVRGSVGNRAAVFALEVLAHPVWAVPTIVLPYHPGHGSATRIIPGTDALKTLLHDLLASPWIGEVEAVLSGYMANAGQVEAVAGFISELKRRNARLLHACDPVMGDNGRLYVASETAEAIRDMLVPGADILTPNRFELGWLTKRPVEDLESARQAVSALTTPLALVTSMPAMMHGNIANLLVAEGVSHLCEHRCLDRPPNGPGDLTAAVFLSHLLRERRPVEALRLATASVFEIVRNAASRGADELMLETDSQAILNPRAPVSVRSLV